MLSKIILLAILFWGVIIKEFKKSKKRQESDNYCDYQDQITDNGTTQHHAPEDTPDNNDIDDNDVDDIDFD